MPSLSELRGRLNSSHDQAEQWSGATEMIIRDLRSTMTPSQQVEQKMEQVVGRKIVKPR